MTQTKALLGLRRNPAILTVALAVLAALPLRIPAQSAPHNPLASAGLRSSSAETTELSALAQFSAWAEAWLAEPRSMNVRPGFLAQGEKLAIERRAALKRLIRTNPRLALTAAASERLHAQLPPLIGRHLEQHVSRTGSLTVLVADDFDHGTAQVLHQASIGGQTYQAFVYGHRLQLPSQSNVLLEGIAIDDLLAVADDPASPNPSAAHAGYSGGPVPLVGAFPGSHTLGPKTVLLMRVAFPDDPAEPITQAKACSMMNQVDQFYIENSYQATAILADVTPLLVLPHTKSVYGYAGTSPLQADARAAALAAGFDTDSYDLDIVLFHPVPGPGFAGWNGLANIGAKGVWLQGTTSPGIAAHELGHNYGLYHANFWSATGDSIIGPGSTVEYGDPFDTMALAQLNPMPYHFNAPYKSQLQWLSFPFIQPITNSGTFRLFAFDVPQLVAGQAYALTIYKDAARTYWVSFRQQITNNPWLENGPLLQWAPWNNGVANSLNGTDLLDTTPGTPTGDSGKDDSPVAIGRTFSDPAAGICITPIAKGSGPGGNYFDVQVNLGPFPTNLPPTLAIVADQTNVAPNVPINFTATASDPNGDTLALYWDFGDLSFGSNSTAATKAWSTPGEYVVRCIATDMKGGLCARQLLITVGAPAVYHVTGQITSGGLPLQGVRIYNGLTGSSYRGAYTDSDGDFLLANLSAGNYTLAAVEYGHTLSPVAWTNPVSVGPDAAGLNWTASLSPLVTATAPVPSAAKPSPTAIPGTFSISRAGSLAAPLTVNFNLNGTATYETDYNLTPGLTGPPYQVVFPPGLASSNLVVMPLNSTTTNGTETSVLTLLEDPSYTLGSFAEATVSIADNRLTPLPTVNVVADQDTALQSGPTTGLLNFTSDINFTNDLIVRYALSGTALMGSDYLPLSGSITIPAGQTNAFLPLVPIDDLQIGTNHTALVTLQQNPAYQLGPNPSANITFLDNNPPPVFITTTSDLPLEGSPNTGAFTVTRLGNLSANLLISYALSGSAVNGIDYAALPGSLLIPAGQPTATIIVSPLQDAPLPAGNRTVVASLSTNAGSNIVNPGSATITILDDDLPGVSLVPSLPTALEGGTNGAFTFTRTGSAAAPLTVFFTIYGTAINGADYAPITNSLVIPAGTNGASLAISALPDAIHEASETVILTLECSPAYTVLTTIPQTVTIMDNNPGALPGVGFDLAAASGTRGVGIVTVFVLLSAPSTAAVTVSYAATGGTAIGGFVDYYLPSGQLTFAPGQTNQSFTFFVLNNSLLNPDKTIVISLSSPSNALLDVNSNLVYTILANSPSGTVTVSAPQPNASPLGPISGLFRIARSAGTNSDLTVSYQVTGTAGSPGDFLALGNSAVIPAGQTNVDIVVTPSANPVPEPAQSVILTLTSVPDGAVIGSPATATVWITNNYSTANSPVVSLIATTPFASEVGPTAGLLAFRRDRDTNDALPVNFTVGGTARSGTDYVPLSAPATIPAGALEADLPVTPLWSGPYTSNKTVLVTLTVDGAFRVAPALADATVTLLGGTPPSIATEPQSQTIPAGSNATFSVLAEGSSPLAFQWLFDSTPIATGTSSLLGLTNVPVTLAGSYDCVITNAFGSTTSSVAALTVTREPLRFDTSAHAMYVSNGVFQARLLGLAGAGPVVIFTSPDLRAWTPLLTNPPVVGSLEFIDPTVFNADHRYYRAAE